MEESYYLIKRPVVFQEAYLYSLKRKPRKGGRLNSLFSVGETFFPGGYYETGTGVTLSRPIVQMNFTASFCLLACSKMQIMQFLLQLKAPSPVSAIVVNIVLFLGEGSRH